MGLNEKLREVSEMLEKTRQYLELKQARTRIESSKDLKAKVEHYKVKQQELFSSKFSAKEMDIKAGELNNLLTNLSKVPEIDSFLKAEKAFGDLLQNVFKTIGQNIESGLKQH